MKKKRLYRWLIVSVVIAILGTLSYVSIKKWALRKFGVSELTIAYELLKQGFSLRSSEETLSPPRAKETAVQQPPLLKNSTIKPFHEIGTHLGRRAKGNNMFQSRGVVIFDANEDNRLDLFFVHSGRPRARATDENSIMQEEKVPAKPCVLYLNQGNAPNGDPVYASVEDLQEKGNMLYVRDELLAENKYIPRTSIQEDEFGPGRIATSAMAADLNGDGLQDLLIGNSHDGIPFQTHDLGLRVYPSKDNVGHHERREILVNRTPSFLWGDMVDGKDVLVHFGDQPEPEGRNTPLINKGDQDQDGIPEWEDVTQEVGFGGKWATIGFTIADIDRDGDLDVYVSNFVDLDFWGFGAKKFAGNQNELYINQLAETGKFYFEERALAYGVAGLHQEGQHPSDVWFPAEQRFKPISVHRREGTVVGEAADHSWAAQFLDWNDDGWLDLIVANDGGNRLRVYENQYGKRFDRVKKFDDPSWDGRWKWRFGWRSVRRNHYKRLWKSSVCG